MDKGGVREHRHMSQHLVAHIPIELWNGIAISTCTSSKLWYYLKLTAQGCSQVEIHVEYIGCKNKSEMQIQQGNLEMTAILQLDVAGNLCRLIELREQRMT